MTVPKKKQPKPRRPKGTGGLITKGGLTYGRLRVNGELVYTDGYADPAAAEKALDRLVYGQVNPKFIPTLCEFWRSLAEEGGEFEDRFEPETRDLYDTVRAGYFATEDGDTKRLCYFLGAMRIDQIRKPDCQRAYNKLVKKVARSTARRYMSCVRQVLQHAVDRDILVDRLENGKVIPANPADRLEYKPIPDAPFYILSDEQLRTLPDELYKFSPRLSAMMTVIFDTGARPGEVCAMDTQDISPDGVWHIHDTRKRSGSLKGETKSGRDRYIKLSEDALAAIALHGAKKGPVWLTKQGRPMNPGWFACQLRRFRKSLQKKWDAEATARGEDEAAVVPPITARNCRKTFATRGAETGDVKATQTALGHKHASTTLDIYAKARRGAQAPLIAKLAEGVGKRGRWSDKDRNRDHEEGSASTA